MSPERGNPGSGEVALMSKDVTLHLDEFGQRALARFARGRRGSAAAAVRTASLYYLADRDSERPAWRVPRFDKGKREEQPTLRVRLDDDTWRALDEEAGRQGVTADALAVHAVLYFLADLDSGRLADLLEEALEDADK
jgi:hypothetical protein